MDKTIAIIIGLVCFILAMIGFIIVTLMEANDGE